MQYNDHDNDTHQQRQDAGVEGDEFGDRAERRVQHQAIGKTAPNQPARGNDHNTQRVTPPGIAAGIGQRQVSVS